MERRSPEDKTGTIWRKIEDGEGLFLGLGTGYEEFEAGPGNFTTAIIERPDGTIETPEVSMIQFIEPHEEGEAPYWK